MRRLLVTLATLVAVAATPAAATAQCRTIDGLTICQRSLPATCQRFGVAGHYRYGYIRHHRFIACRRGIG